MRWAQELLPTSNLGSSAHLPIWSSSGSPLLRCQNPPGTGPSPVLHYAALTAPGPTGTRPEHITDLLNVPRRIHANKIHAALSALFCRISAGALPPAARWLTRTRLCWQRKKNGKTVVPSRSGEFPSLCLRQALGELVPGAPPHQDSCTCISGASTCRERVKLCATGEARSNLWCSTARSSRWSRLKWTLSTCLATLSGLTSGPLCAPHFSRGFLLDRVAAPV